MAEGLMQGRVWCVGDNISTDLILPVIIDRQAREERPKHMFSAIRPGWADEVHKGDILIAGRNYGMGSSRPAAQVMKDLGLACLAAESVNGLFFRSCVNYAFPALEVPGVRAAFDEGDEAEVDFVAGVVRNHRTGVELHGAPWPDAALDIWRAGGFVAQLDERGLLHAPAWSLHTAEPPPPEVP